jgi:hypothetical protein
MSDLMPPGYGFVNPALTLSGPRSVRGMIRQKTVNENDSHLQSPQDGL